jgi:predicted nucleotidyltransferase
MANLFNQDFQDFLQALNNNKVEYILVGGYAVILHGYIRSTADMDVWINKTKENYKKLQLALTEFGAPLFPEEEFLGNKFDVWGFGREPNKIEIMSEVKGVDFTEAYERYKAFLQNDVEIKYIDLNDLLKAKEAAGRFKDKDDIEQLNRRNNS